MTNLNLNFQVNEPVININSSDSVNSAMNFAQLETKNTQWNKQLFSKAVHSREHNCTRKESETNNQDEANLSPSFNNAQNLDYNRIQNH